MTERPDAADLLLTARRTLLDELMPQIPESRHYTALMIANAMAIGARESREADGLERETADMLRELYGEEAFAASGATSTERCHALASRLARELRAGSLTAERERLFRRLARARLRRRIAVSNPRFLEAVET